MTTTGRYILVLFVAIVIVQTGKEFLCIAGHARNIYFSFDIVQDTAIDVAIEMVKELEISDWEPLEIAGMIEEEISSLVPTWKDWGSSQYHNQHSFSYEEEDEDGIHHPFYTSSSCSSTAACLPALSSSYKSHNRGNNVATDIDWRQGKCSLSFLS